MNLKKRELALNSGQTAWSEYDKDGDVLEIIFQPEEATCAIELTESIVLRFDWESNHPLSLSFISFSQLLRPNEFGEVHFQLLADQWPEQAREKIWAMLRQSPLSEFLKLSGYVPAHNHQIIPMAAIKQSRLTAQAA